MSLRINGAKSRRWAERLQRFSQSELTVGAFCRDEKVSEASFYYWRKKIDGPRKASLGETNVEGGVFRSVEVVPATATVEVLFQHGAKLQVRGNQLDVVRAVVAELARPDSPC